MVWYFHLLKNFLQFVVIHTGKIFGVINTAEVDVLPDPGIKPISPVPLALAGGAIITEPPGKPPYKVLLFIFDK